MTTEQKLSQVIEWVINKMYFLYEEGNHYSENDIQRVAQRKARELQHDTWQNGFREGVRYQKLTLESELGNTKQESTDV